MEKFEKKRIEHVDIAKGISIVLVSLFHSELSRYIPAITESMSVFRVPLFFFLSGIFFSYSLSFLVFSKKKFDSLLKPYFVVLIGIYLLSLLYKEGYRVSEFLGIFYGNGSTLRWTPMWFLSHLFVVNTATFLVFKYTRFLVLPLVLKVSLIALALVLGSAIIDFFYAKNFAFFSLSAIGLPFSIDLCAITVPFFVLGYLLRDYVCAFKVNPILLFLAALIFFLISYFSSAKIDLNMRLLNLPFWSLLGSFCGIYLVLSLSYWIKRCDGLKYLLLVVGRASLFILIFHFWFGWHIYYILMRLIDHDNYPLVIALLAFVGSIVAPVLLQNFVKSIPFLKIGFFPSEKK